MGLIIRSSSIHAAGCYTTTDIRKGTRVAEYTGRLLSKADADTAYEDSPITYLFGLGDGSVVIDGHCTAMFINHSCAANCETSEEDGRVWVTAIRNISAGEETLARVRLAALMRSPPPPLPQQAAKVPRKSDEMSWSDADRRSVQSALTALGDYQGPINGTFASSIMRTAVLHWQTFDGFETTGQLSADQRDRILREANLQAGLLKVPSQSPRGKAANSLRGAETRFNRGVAFDKGTGQSKDAAEAAYWYALAASDGWPGAYTNLGMLYALGQGVRQDLQAARRLWLTAAALGDGIAMFNLGALAETGFGGQPADLAEAKRWYSRGAEHRHAESAAALERLGG